MTLFFKKATAFSYILSLVLLYFVVNDHSQYWPSSPLVLTEKATLFLLLMACLLAVDWIVKQQYWATAGNFHLLIFVLGLFSLPELPSDNWIILFFFFFWVSFIHLINACRKENRIKGVFNAGFLIALGSFFFPEGAFTFPFIWIVLFIYGAMSPQTLMASTLPLGALFLLEVFLAEFIPGARLAVFPNTSNVLFSSPWKERAVENLWWICMLILFFLATTRRYIDINSKGATYRAGMFCLLATALIGLVFPLLFSQLSSALWILFIMALAALSSRFFEEIKKTWVRELLFMGYIGLILISKNRLFFF